MKRIEYDILKQAKESVKGPYHTSEPFLYTHQTYNPSYKAWVISDAMPLVECLQIMKAKRAVKALVLFGIDYPNMPYITLDETWTGYVRKIRAIDIAEKRVKNAMKEIDNKK